MRPKKIYIVLCYCCTPSQWKIFLTREDAIGHSQDREEWEQEVFEIELNEPIYETETMRNIN